MRSTFLLGLFLSLALHAIEPLRSLSTDAVTIQARRVHFNGQQIVLTDGIQLGHELGSVTAHEARFLVGGGHAVQAIELRENVLIDIGKAGSLACWNARIDTQERTGHFTGLLPLERVRYVDGALKLECHAMEVTVDAAHEKDLPLPEVLRVITAQGDVRLSNDGLLARSETLTYWRSAPEHTPSPIAHTTAPLCDLLCFESCVRIAIEAVALQTDGAIWIARTGEMDAPTVSRLVAPGPCHIVFDADTQRQLSCPGLLIVDLEQGKAYLQGGDTQQIFYQDDMGSVYADSMVVDFALNDKQLAPAHIVLEGNVKLCNQQLGTSGPMNIQYALADYVVYSPTEERMVLRGAEGNRVLFLDETAHTRGSAAQVTFDRKKCLVEAHGAVRFSLKEEETRRLLERVAP